MTQLFRSAANSRLMAGGLVGSTSQLGGMKAAAALPGRQEKTESGWLKDDLQRNGAMERWLSPFLGVSENRG